MKNLLFFLVLGILNFSAYCQSPEDSAGIFIISATSQYEMQDFDRALGYLQRAEDILGHSNPDLEALRVKCHFFAGNMTEAKASLARFFAFEEIENGLWGEISLYIVKIDDIEQEAERKRKEEEEKLRQLIAGTTFYNGLGLVKNDKHKYGYINPQGEVKIDYQFDRATSFEKEYAKVEKNGESALINVQGEFVVPLQKYHQLDDEFDKNGFVCYISDNYRSGKTPYEIGFIDKGGNTYYSFDSENIESDILKIYYLGMLQAHYQNQFDKAIKFGEMIPKNNTNYLDAQRIMGDIYYTGSSEIRSNKVKAMEFYDQLDQNAIRSLENTDRERIGDLYAEGNQNQKTRALLFYDGLDAFDFKYIRNAIEVNQFQAAEAKLLQMDPKKIGDEGVAAEVYFLNGYLCEHKGDIKNAKKHYKKVKSFNKTTPKIANEALMRAEGLKKS